MQLFKDAALTDQIITLDLGIVPAGETKSYTFYLYNDTDAELIDIVVACNHVEVRVVRAPETLLAKASAALEVSWSPAVTVKQGLHTEVVFSGKELWS